jgi:hypothetical protein
VLTRDDYLGFSANGEALSAIVKANLITHHLLFVGFGLADDHFQQIVHDVQRALPDNADRVERATALTMRVDHLDEVLWGKRLTLISMGGKSIEDDDVATASAARRLEIFLDALLAYATDSHSYLLDDDFESSLADDQRQLRTEVLAFAGALNETHRSDAAWPVIERMLTDLGWAGMHTVLPK